MWKTLLSTVLLASIPSAQADVNAFKACIMAKVEPLRSACPTQECTPSCKAAAGKVIDSLDGSCCSNVDAATDGLSPETCKAMMSSQVVPKIKEAVEHSCGAPDLSETLSMFDVFKKQENIAPVSANKLNTNLVAVMNATLGQRAAKQLENELNLANANVHSLPGHQFETKSKVTLAVLMMFNGAFFGCDRCFLGQPILGTLKGVTLGGLIIWALIDSIIILINMLQKATVLDTFGFQARFPRDEVDTAFYISLVGFVANIVLNAGAKGSLGAAGRQISKFRKVETDPEDSEDSPALYHQLSA